MASAFWDEVWRIVERGECPVVKIPRSALVIYSKTSWGTPRDLQGFATYDLRLPSGVPMRCRNRGCRNFLRRKTVNIVCSEGCRKALLEFCEVTTAVLLGEITPDEYPGHYRTDRGVRANHPRPPVTRQKASKRRKRKASIHMTSGDKRRSNLITFKSKEAA